MNVGRRLARPLPLLALLLPGLAGLLILLLAGHGAASLGLAAILLGLRHAFDADHIAAIDNMTRRLRYAGRPASGVGLFFSLGHSTVVLTVTVLVVYMSRQTTTGAALLEPLTRWGTVAGTLVSALFLSLIGATNLKLLLRMRHDGGTGQRPIVRPGLQALSERVGRSWQAYPLGLLFGLSFDTASEIALLALAIGASQAGALPVALTLAFPLLFAIGMGTVDAVEGLLMSRLYDWAANDADRHLRLNATVTGISVLLALAVAASQWWQLLAGDHAVTAWRGPSSDQIGLLVTSVLLLLWLFAWAWRGSKGTKASTTDFTGKTF